MVSSPFFFLFPLIWIMRAVCCRGYRCWEVGSWILGPRENFLIVPVSPRGREEEGNCPGEAGLFGLLRVGAMGDFSPRGFDAVDGL